MGLYFFRVPPDIPVPLTAIDDLRQAYRSALTGGLVQLDVIEIDGIPTIKLISKSRKREPHRMTYLGALTFPRRDFSYVLKIQCSEYGITGMREAVVVDRCPRDGRVSIDKDQIRGWAADPYDSSIQGDVLNTLADVAEYDGEFPDHPLSRLRRYLRTMQDSVVISEALRGAIPFQGID